MSKEIPGSEIIKEEPPKKRDDSVHFTRHSRADYLTYRKIKSSDNPRRKINPDDQVTPDLPEAGIKLAREQAELFFSNLDPQKDVLFFAASEEARAIETANIYREVAKLKGFEVLKPEHARSRVAEEIGQGEIRTIKNLSIGEEVLMQAVFNPDSQLGGINWDAVDDDFKRRWKLARQIIDAHDYGSFGPNFFHHSEEIKKIFPEIKSAEEMYETKFKNLLRLARFAVKKAEESGIEKNIKVLAFGHENYTSYALNKYFGEHDMKNCETIDVAIKGTGIEINRRGVSKNIETEIE